MQAKAAESTPPRALRKARYQQLFWCLRRTTVLIVAYRLGYSFSPATLLCLTFEGYINSFGIFQSYYASSLSLPPSTISWIGSVHVFCVFVMGAFSGHALDTAYYRALLLTGCGMQLLNVFTTSVCTTNWQLLLSQGLCQGLGDGLIFASTVVHVFAYFGKNSSLAISTAAAGAATGGIIFPLVTQQLPPRIGFGWSARVMVFVVLANSVIVLVATRSHLQPRGVGPSVELAAFKELAYLLFVASMFFTL